jgi:hypothetical protein
MINRNRDLLDIVSEGELMVIRYYWQDDEKTLIRYELEGSWTWDEMYQVLYEAREEILAIDHRVDAIIDLRNTHNVPAAGLTHIKRVSDLNTPNTVLSVFVTSSGFFRSLYEMAARIHKKVAQHYRIVSTIEEAEALIAASRQAGSSEPTGDD